MAAFLAEAEAVARVLAGDESAYAALVRDHQEAAFRAAFLILRDSAAAEDAAQQGLIRAYSNLNRFRPGEPFRPWLLRIVTNLALNEARSRGRRAGLLARFAGSTKAVEESAEPPPEVLIQASEEARTLWRAIDELSPGDKVVLDQRYFLDLSESEMATALSTRPGTVKSRLHRSGRRLRQLIERDFPELKERI